MKTRTKKPLSSVFLFCGLSAYSYCVIHVVWNYIISYAQLTGNSMAPTLNYNNDGRSDIILAEHITRHTRKLKHNDIVLATDPDDAKRCVCKRIIAMEGDKIPATVIEPCRHTHIPKGHVWLEGDNSENSRDSRQFGPIPYSLIQSKVFFRVWPLSKLGPIR